MTKTIARVIMTILGGAALAMPSVARANYTLSITETGGPTFNTAGGFTAGTAISQTVGDFTVSGTLVDMQDPSQALLFFQSLTLQNNAGSAHQLTVTLTDNAFTMPGSSGTSMNVDSQLSATAITPGGFVTFQSFFNGSPVSASPQQANAPGGFSDVGNTFTRGASFAMQNVTQINLGPSGRIQETGATTATAGNVIPEPATMALTLAGLGSMGLMPWLKRRRKA